jgi:hypothetical protein
MKRVILLSTLLLSIALATDVGVTRILAPVGTIDSGTVVTPACSVYNYDIAVASYWIRCRIGATYNTSTYLSAHIGRQWRYVTFTQWVAAPVGNVAVRCSTMQSPDSNPANNWRDTTVTVQRVAAHDVGCTRIVAPSGSVDSGTIVTPACSVYNYGGFTETFNVRMKIGAGYNQTAAVISLSPGGRLYVALPNWTAGSRGTYAVTCSTELAGDVTPANDKRTGSVYVGVHDVGVTCIIAPRDTVDSGTVITPACSVYNYGSEWESYNAQMTIATPTPDSRTATVNSHAPGSSIYLTFPDWTANPVGGPYTVKCTTQLGGDANPANSRRDTWVRVRSPVWRDSSWWLEVQGCWMPPLAPCLPDTSSLMWWRGMLGQNVTPTCSVCNRGVMTTAYNLVWEIGGGASYNETLHVSNHLPGLTRGFAFPTWQAGPVGTSAFRCTVIVESAFNRAKSCVRGVAEILDTIGVDVMSLGRVACQPGDSVVATFDVWNLGAAPDSYRCEVSQTRNWPTSISDTFTQSLSAQGRARGGIDFLVPVGEPVGTVNWVTLKATSLTNPLWKDSAHQKLEVVQRSWVEAETILGIPSPAESASVTPRVRYRNLGDVAVTCTTSLDIDRWNVFPAGTGPDTCRIEVPPRTDNVGWPWKDVFVNTVFNNVALMGCGPYRWPVGSVLFGSQFVGLWAQCIGNHWPLVRGSLTLRPTLVVEPEGMPGNGFRQWANCLELYDWPAERWRGQIGMWYPDSMLTRQGVRRTQLVQLWVTVGCPVHGPTTFMVTYPSSGVGAPVKEPGVGGQDSPGYHNIRTITLLPGAVQEVAYDPWPVMAGSWEASARPNPAGFDSLRYGLKSRSCVYNFDAVNPNASNWTRMADLPAGAKRKSVKDGGSLSYWPDSTSEYVYALKGNGTCEFYRYGVTNNVWEAKESIPAIGRSGKKKGVKKGGGLMESVLIRLWRAMWEGVYAFKGNSTFEWWRYERLPAGMPGPSQWIQKTDIPPGARPCKEGCRAVGVTVNDTDFVYFLKGSGTQEFYRYNTALDNWTTMANAPLGASGKPYKNGSGLCARDSTTIYALKGSYNEFYAYDVATNTWTTKTPLPMTGSSGKKKKVKDGAGLAFLNNTVYCLKGGGTREFWTWQADSDKWTQLEDMPSGGGRPVKGGGALTRANDKLFAFKGNNTLEFYSYTPVSAVSREQIAGSSVRSSSGLRAASPVLEVCPTPSSREATIRYSLPKPGNASLKLFDVTGKLVATLASGYHAAGLSSLRLSPSSLSSGMYILNLTTECATLTRKLIIE